MGTFLRITYESRYAGNFDNNVKQNKILDYIIDNLNDMTWQESISNQLQKTDKHHTSLSIFLRVFDVKDIKEGGLKSCTRYKQKEDILVIDQMIALNEFIESPENEMRNKLCNAIFIYLKEVQIKYKTRFQDFDSVAFIPLLENQLKKIINNEFEDTFYETESFAMLKQAEEIISKFHNQ